MTKFEKNDETTMYQCFVLKSTHCKYLSREPIHTCNFGVVCQSHAAQCVISSTSYNPCAFITMSV